MKLGQERGGSIDPCMPGCLVGCSIVFNDADGNHVTSSFEYETIALMGTNLGIVDPDVVAQFDRIVDDIGIDYGTVRQERQELVDEQAADEDSKSQAESTYSTTGTGSSPVTNPETTRTASSVATAKPSSSSSASTCSAFGAGS